MFATNSFSELGRDECENLNFMNFKMVSFKVRKNSRILRNFKIREIRIPNLWYNLQVRQNVVMHCSWRKQLDEIRKCESTVSFSVSPSPPSKRD